MLRAITPNRERAVRKAMRDARKAMDAAALEFLAAGKALRAAQRARDAAPVLDFGIGYALCGRNVAAANRAWRERFTYPLERALHDAHERYETALHAVQESRYWYRHRRAVVRAIDSGEQPVEVGAAWSPRGLASFRASHR